ncbi:MAG TPA: 4Fe-4S dicluster domain-containing protein, partial [Longimicrobiales bacterium]|nr:4Fe-4S dicluster domain-containing protein [Longimicrobiales bacterium]
LFNVRSCDVAGLAFVREMHARDLPDDAVLRRADRLTLVSLACSRPCPWGFCICCGAGPFLERDYDLQLTDLEDGLFAEVGSDRGQALLDRAPDLFRPATRTEVQRRQAAEDTARDSFGTETCHFGSAMRRISTRRVSDALWQAMSPWCLECGGCNHVCPTCYCFSVADVAEGEDAWLRCKLWDSCQYAAFTLEASGHNPRAARAERMKRRFHHKVSAQYFARDGRLGCVGCGRCIRVCLGTTDMPSVVAAIRKGEWQGGRACD